MQDKATRFWAKVQVGNPDECWNWRGHIGKDGMGYAYTGPNQKRSAARVAWEMTHGPIVETTRPKMVKHTCGNRLCCNPAHLRLLDTDFWANVDIRGEDDCWEWMGSYRSNGYGQYGLNGENIIAHRMAYELRYGPIGKMENGKSLHVCHKCDNPKCCNPNHLFLGTPRDNVRDMIQKGRCIRARGESASNTVLTERQVREIRQLRGYSQYAVAAMYGVSRGAIAAVVRRRTWRHIP